MTRHTVCNVAYSDHEKAFKASVYDGEGAQCHGLLTLFDMVQV